MQNRSRRQPDDKNKIGKEPPPQKEEPKQAFDLEQAFDEAFGKLLPQKPAAPKKIDPDFEQSLNEVLEELEEKLKPQRPIPARLSCSILMELECIQNRIDAIRGIVETDDALQLRSVRVEIREALWGLTLIRKNVNRSLGLG
jgi:hypothetical protein